MRKKRKKKKGVRSGSRTPLQQHMLSWETRRMLEDIRPHLCLSLPHSCITFFSSSEKVIGTTIFQSGCSISIWRGKSEVKLGQERKRWTIMFRVLSYRSRHLSTDYTFDWRVLLSYHSEFLFSPFLCWEYSSNHLIVVGMERTQQSTDLDSMQIWSKHKKFTWKIVNCQCDSSS